MSEARRCGIAAMLDYWIKLLEDMEEQGHEGIAFIELRREDCEMMREEVRRLTQEAADVIAQLELARLAAAKREPEPVPYTRCYGTGDDGEIPR